MSGLGGIGIGGYNPYAAQQFQQNLFNQIDGNGDGSISKTELEQAVTAAGGSTQGADALWQQLDPNGTGSVSEQQFAQAFPRPAYSDQMQAQMIGYQAQGWPGAQGSGQSQGQSTVGGLAQSLFSQIDTNGDGSISQSELEQAVTAAGGTTQAADALYAKLDPNNTGSVSEQQLSQLLSQSSPHHHHHHHGGAAGASTGGNAGDALASLFNADGGDEGNTSPTQVAQNIFSAIDTSGTGSITQTELEQAVTAAGGSTQGADALWQQLDPNGTGSVSQQQFVQALQPPTPSGNTANDALLALLDQATQDGTGTTASSTSAASSTTSTSSDGGNSAQDALAALLQSFDAAESKTLAGGSSPQDALLALINSGNGSSNTNSTTGGANSANLTLALSMYQTQLNQQLFGSAFASA